MKDIEALLKKVDKDFSKSKASFQKHVKKVKEIQNYKDIIALNGKDNTIKRLDHLSISPNDHLLRERIIGKNNNLMDISFLKKGLEVSKTVCRIVEMNRENKTPIGTGFLIESGLLMTNNHVIRRRSQARKFLAEFEYEKDSNGKMMNSYLFDLSPDTFFCTSEKLDYSIVAVAANSSNDPTKKLTSYGWNNLSTSHSVLVGETVNIIQHPEGMPKMIATRENIVTEIPENKIHYTTDTQPGSSGALVANDQWEIIALHRSGVPETDKKDRILLRKGGIYKGYQDKPFINWIANQGVLVSAILDDVARKKSHSGSKKIRDRILKNYHTNEREEGYKLPK